MELSVDRDEYLTFLKEREGVVLDGRPRGLSDLSDEGGVVLDLR